MADKDINMRSAFCVLNNPEEHGYKGTPQEITMQIIDKWQFSKSGRVCAACYCVSEKGLHHVHFVCESPTVFRFSAIKTVFGTAHIEPTRGTKKDAQDYLNKVGRFEEKGEKVLFSLGVDNITAEQGKRNDLNDYKQMFIDGLTPDDIINEDWNRQRQQALINSLYYRFKEEETSVDVPCDVYWLSGKSGCGKSYYSRHSEEWRDSYFVTDYDNPFDDYNGEKSIVFEEFRGQIPLSRMLQYLDRYKVSLKCRYANKRKLWNKVLICTVKLPSECYINTEQDRTEERKQLYRRIKSLTSCYILNNEYKQCKMPLINITRAEFDLILDSLQKGLKATLSSFTIQEELPF